MLQNTNTIFTFLFIAAIEGYVLIATNLHPETTEDNIYDVFEEYSRISNLHLNHDKHSGFVKGYAFIEFKDIEDVIGVMKVHRNKKFEILGRQLELDYAFVESPSDSDRKPYIPLSKRIQSRKANSRLDGSNKRDYSPTR